MDSRIRSCRTAVPRYAVIGTHNSGKTTIVLEVTSLLRQMGMDAGIALEPSRSSTYLASGWRGYDTQLELFAGTIAAESEAVRSSSVVVCDRSLVDVLAYTSNLPDPQTPEQESVRDGMWEFGERYIPTYRACFLPAWQFDMAQSDDPLREGDRRFQMLIADSVETVAKRCQAKVVLIPDSNGASQFVADYIVADLPKVTR